MSMGSMSRVMAILLCCTCYHFLIMRESTPGTGRVDERIDVLGWLESNREPFFVGSR